MYAIRRFSYAALFVLLNASLAISQETVPPSDWRALPLGAASSDKTWADRFMKDHASKATKTRTAKIVVRPRTTAWWAMKLDGGRVNDIIFTWLRIPNAGPKLAVVFSTNSNDGLNGDWSALPGYGGETGQRRSGALVDAKLARSAPVWIKVIAGENKGRTPVVYTVQANEKPGHKPFDSLHIVGASREVNQRSDELEAAVIAAYPDRDPLVFVSAIGGASVETIVKRWDDTGGRTRGLAYFCEPGSVIGNNISKNRPYSETQKSSLVRNLDRLMSRIEDTGQKLLIGNTSFRAYPEHPAVTEIDQAAGSKPYNDEIIHPLILKYAPDSFDLTYGRPYLDEYLYTLRNRGELSDGVHAQPPKGDGYAGVIGYKVKTLYHRIYQGSWPRSFVEELVEKAETNGGADVQEARYAVDALTDGVAKDVLSRRLKALD